MGKFVQATPHGLATKISRSNQDPPLPTHETAHQEKAGSAATLNENKHSTVSKFSITLLNY